MAIGRITLRFLQGGKEALCTFDHQAPTDSDADWDQVLDYYRTGWVGHIRPIISNQCVLQTIEFTQPFRLRSEQVGMAGLATGSALPINSCVMIKKEVVGDRNGRFFHPGIINAQVDTGGNILSAHLAQWATALPLFHGVVGNGGPGSFGAMVVRHAGINPPSIVSALTARPLIGVQRRRLR
jgi:hypothetical protein